MWWIYWYVAQFTWQGKDKKDDYGAWILEEYTVTDWTVHLPSANKVRHCYATDKIPAKFDYNDGNGEIDLVVPDDAVVRTHDENGIRFKRRIHSEDYNASLKDKYSPRKDRNEWNLIGLLGQVPMTKNQKTGDRWSKMKDISGSVEMWFIR